MHFINEKITRKELIDPQLEKAGWFLRDKTKVKIEIPVDGYDAAPWNGITYYSLYRENGEILAIVEAKEPLPMFAWRKLNWSITLKKSKSANLSDPSGFWRMDIGCISWISRFLRCVRLKDFSPGMILKFTCLPASTENRSVQFKSIIKLLTAHTSMRRLGRPLPRRQSREPVLPGAWLSPALS